MYAPWGLSCAQDAPGAAEDTGADEHQAIDQFKREVAETFLRCIKEGISQDNAVIELNGLKIAEDRTFADCARSANGALSVADGAGIVFWRPLLLCARTAGSQGRWRQQQQSCTHKPDGRLCAEAAPHNSPPPPQRRYMFTTMLGLCLPPTPAVKAEYRALYPDLQVGPSTKEGRLELLRRINMQLKAWKELLHRFLKSADDQVGARLRELHPALPATAAAGRPHGLLHMARPIIKDISCCACAGGAAAHV